MLQNLLEPKYFDRLYKMNIGSKQILAQKNGTQKIFCVPKTLALEKMAPKIWA